MNAYMTLALAGFFALGVVTGLRVAAASGWISEVLHRWEDDMPGKNYDLDEDISPLYLYKADL